MPPRCRAFSLLELMIGIVILGLGMVMVATIFPVAWNRARTLNEYTVERATVSGAHALVKSLVHVSSPDADSPSFNASSFFGDWMYDVLNDQPVLACMGPPDCAGAEWLIDTWVHALNMENIQVAGALGPKRFVPEDPWRLEAPCFEPVFVAGLPAEIVEGSFLRYVGPAQPRALSNVQVSFRERIQPPMRERDGDTVDAYGVFTGADDTWDDTLSSRRFCWAVFHRFRAPGEYDPADPAANAIAQGALRSFDVYYVTLRRPRPTYRYARQDPDPANLPDPCDLAATPVIPAARPSDEDVMFPVPWRVQVQFPAGLAAEAGATGIPTEIAVPPEDFPDDIQAKAMLVGMFPSGAWFIDEITGAVYQVVKRRITGDEDDQAVLTLDREVFLEDVTLPENDPQCGAPCTLGPYVHLVRTVRVFPPPVESDSTAGQEPRTTLTFAGSQPVVGIDVRTLNIVPD